jgi:hypothetical protein
LLLGLNSKYEQWGTLGPVLIFGGKASGSSSDSKNEGKKDYSEGA